MKLLQHGRTKTHHITLLMLSLTVLLFAIPVKADDNPTVLMFDVQGNSHVPAEKILGAISHTKIGEPFNPDKAQLDAKAILALGYFADVQYSTAKMFDGVKLEFDVVENPVFHELQITGLTKMKPGDLRSLFSQKTGEIFNATVFKEDLAKALKYCRDAKGLFIEPKIDQLNISPDGVVHLELVELRIGKIKVEGLVKTKEIVVRRELTIKEGDILDYNILKDEYDRLMRLRLFDSIDFHFETGSSPGTLDLIIQPKEGQVGSFSIGASYAQDTGELGGVLGYSDPNIMGMGQSLSMDINIDPSEQNVEISFIEPWLDKHHTSFSLSVWNTTSTISSTMEKWLPSGYLAGLPSDHYDIGLVQNGIAAGFGRPLGKYLTGSIKFSFDKDQIQNFWPYNYTSDHTGEASLPFPPNPATPFQYWDNAVIFSLDQNKLKYKNVNFVNGGSELSASEQAAGTYIGGAWNYNKLTLDGKWFKPLTSSLIFGTHFQGVDLTGNYPDYDTLYLGGMYRLRAYDDRRFHDNNGDNMVGDKYILNNTELRWQPKGEDLKNLEVVMFYDAGLIRNSQTDTESFKSDYGFGLRYNLPMVGMLRLDDAHGRDRNSRFVVSIGEVF